MWKLNDFQEAQADLGETPSVDFLVMRALFKEACPEAEVLDSGSLRKSIGEL